MDMINHVNTPIDKMKSVRHPQNYFFLAEFSPSFVRVHADRAYPPGNQVYWAYSCSTNNELFITYGFILDINYCDRINVFIMKGEGTDLCETSLDEVWCHFSVLPNEIDMDLMKYVMYRVSGA
jgi:hypothetical protein